MGRPIKKKFFANLNAPGSDYATGGTTGVGGEGVATVTINNAGTLYVSTATVTASAPQIKGGKKATATIEVSTSTGEVTAITLVSAGTGYTSAPTFTVAPATTGTTATFNVTLTSTPDQALAISAWVPGGVAAKAGDIQKQESSTRYRVATDDGVGACKLVAGTPAEGEMTLTATDSDGGTYNVIKLTARRALLVPVTGTQFAENTTAGWNLVAAEANKSVKIGSV